jgi:RNA polymerase sigma-70 factor (ECF subfamily)
MTPHRSPDSASRALKKSVTEAFVATAPTLPVRLAAGRRTRSDPIAVDELERAAFGAALEREGPFLLAAARAITLDQVEAQDLVQSTYELAIRHAHQLRDPGLIRPWLLTILTREGFRVMRRLRRSLSPRGRVVDLQAPDEIGPDAVIVHEALRRLPPRMRAVIVLHHMAGMTVPQVAQAVGRSENTVKSQLTDGRQRLRQWLDDG